MPIAKYFVFHANGVKIDKKSYKNIIHIGYMTVKDLMYTTINSVNPLNLIIDKINDYIEESNGNKYLTLLLMKIKTH